MIQNFEVFIQIILAAFLGGFVGLEREFKRKRAGLKTYMLVCVGSAVFSISAIYGLQFLTLEFEGANISLDVGKIIQAIATGIGFLGAGSIILRENRAEGLTTAAGLWVVASIGVAVGFKLYSIALFATILSIFIFTILKLFEQKYIREKNRGEFEKTIESDD